MKTIWKYTLDVTNEQAVNIPGGAVVLAVQVQDDQPCLWVLVDPNAAKVDVDIRIHGTGHPIPDDLKGFVHIGTFQLESGALMFHVFRGSVGKWDS